MYLDDPCRCTGCGGYGEYECRYQGFKEAPTLVNTYFTYVEHGNTSLIDLPLWVTEVARMVNRYRNLSQRQMDNDRYEKERSQEMLKKAGVM